MIKPLNQGKTNLKLGSPAQPLAVDMDKIAHRKVDIHKDPHLVIFLHLRLPACPKIPHGSFKMSVSNGKNPPPKTTFSGLRQISKGPGELAMEQLAVKNPYFYEKNDYCKNI